MTPAVKFKKQTNLWSFEFQHIYQFVNPSQSPQFIFRPGLNYSPQMFCCGQCFGNEWFALRVLGQSVGSKSFFKQTIASQKQESLADDFIVQQQKKNVHAKILIRAVVGK